MQLSSFRTLKILVVDTKNLCEREHDLANDHRLHELWQHIAGSDIPHATYETEPMSKHSISNTTLELAACGMAFKDGWGNDEVLIIAVCNNDAWIVEKESAPK